jgi:ethanolamine-phosphate cytidylyltransferase
LILPGFVFSLRLPAQLLSNLLKLLCRVAMVRAVKWVDEVIEAVPYEITEEFMNKLFNEYKIDYIIHGDDPCILPDGSDAYAHAKKAGRYKQIKRTEGVSSTDIVGRMLLCVRDRAVSESPVHASLHQQFSHGHSTSHDKGSLNAAGVGTRFSHFLPTSRRIVQFSNQKVAGYQLFPFLHCESH